MDAIIFILVILYSSYAVYWIPLIYRWVRLRFQIELDIIGKLLNIGD